jgi:hypothetical protein
LNVRFIDCVNTTGDEPLNVTVLDPSVIVLMLAFVDEIAAAVTL